MAAVKITQFGDWIFANDNWSCKVGWAESRSQFSSAPVITPRAGSHPIISQGHLSERTIQVTFAYDVTGPLTIDQAIQTLLGRLDPRDLKPRTLLATAFDSTIIQRTAVLSLADGWDIAQSLNTVHVTFVSEQPEWLAVTPTVAGPFELTNAGQQYAAVAVPNSGYASSSPTITLTPGAFSHLSTTATVGWQYRRTISFTNNSSRTWTNRPLRLDLGATDVLVTAGKAQADGDDLRVLLLGEELSRTLIAWNWGQSYAWITPPPIAPGETVTFEIIYGNPSAVNPPVLEGTLHPSIIYQYGAGTATSGTTTTMTDSGATWTPTDINWIGAYVTFVGGALAGQVREITAQTSTSITFAALGSAPVAGQKYLIAHSTNARWWYNTNEYFQSNLTPVRGRWYLNSKTKRPRVIDFTVPASWAPYAMVDNADRFAQTSYSWLDKGGGAKPYAELDAYRSWAGGGPGGRLTSEDGQADGVAFSSCLPILKIRSTMQLSNNLNAAAQAVVMARTGGAEAWETIDSQTANGAVSINVTLPSDDQYYSVYQGLIPTDTEGAIRPDRARDQGSTSDDGNTRNSTTTAALTLRKSPASSGDQVTDSAGNGITVPNATVIERDGRWSGAWRGIIYTTSGGDEYKGWVQYTNLTTEVGGTTLVDASKNWVTNMLTGATVKFTGSPNKTFVGRTAVVASNTATTLTLTTTQRATIPQGTAYEIRQPKTTIRLTDDLYTWLDFDSSLIVLGALSAETAVYQVAAEISVGTPDVLQGRRISARIGLDGRYVFLPSTDALVIDAPTRTAKIIAAGGTTVKRTLTDPAVRFQQSDFDYSSNTMVVTKAGRWLPLPMGGNKITNGDAESAGLAPWAQYINATGVTAVASQDSSVKYAGSKSFKLAISASTAAAGDALVQLLSPSIAVSPREAVYFGAWVRTDNANLQPYLRIDWYNGLTFLGATDTTNAFAPSVNTWYPMAVAGLTYDASVAAQMPAGLSYAGANAFVIGLAIRSTAANATGNVWFDVVDRGSPVITVAETGMNKLGLTVSYRAGYL